MSEWRGRGKLMSVTTAGQRGANAVITQHRLQLERLKKGIKKKVLSVSFMDMDETKL